MIYVMVELAPYAYANDLDEALVRRDYTHDLYPRAISTYVIHEDRIEISGEVWGDLVIGKEEGDEVFLALVDHPIIRRMAAVAQLTLPMSMETMPGIYTNDGTDGYTRWHHLFGLLAFVRKMGHELGIEPRELRRLELVAFFSDVTQWTGSHRGDFILQGFGGAENEHDNRQRETLEKLQLDDFLEPFGWTLDDVLLSSLPEGLSWLETDVKGALCSDRVDYLARQIKRHLNFTMDTERATNFDAFVVDRESGLLVMKNERLALAFGKASLTMVTEHFQEPIHRLILLWDAEISKSILARQGAVMMGPAIDDTLYNPLDYMMSFDSDILGALRPHHRYARTLLQMAEEAARYKRKFYQNVRSSELSDFLIRDDADCMPDPVKLDRRFSEIYSPNPTNIQIVAVEDKSDVSDFGENPHCVDFLLPPLKPRYVNPPFYDSNGEVTNFSKDSVFNQLVDDQQRLLTRTYVARVMVNKSTKTILEDGARRNNELWEEAMARPRMTPEVFRQSFDFAADCSVPHRQARIDWRR